METPIFVVIAYDVTCDKRRTRLAKVLAGYGGERVNYSVFECELRARQYESLRLEILTVIDPEEDRVRYYQLCVDCVNRILLNGKNVPYEKDALLFV